MLGRLLRILLGYFAACLAAGATQTAFATFDLSVLSAGGWAQNAGGIVNLILVAARLSAIFAAPFAFVAICLAYYQDLRGWPYFALVGLAIAAGGFLVLSSADMPGEPTIVNPYALKAYLASGFIGGFVYWLVAGRRAESFPAQTASKGSSAARA